MIVLENVYEEAWIRPQSLQMLGLSVVSLTERSQNIIFSKGINSSLMKKLIKFYKEQILQKQEGKIIDLFGNYTIYIHFYKYEYEIISIFYVNEKDKLVKYGDLCHFSKDLIKFLNSNKPVSQFNQICNKAIPSATGISALFIISTTGHSLFTKIRKDKKYLAENYIQVSGFISALITFSSEVMGSNSGQCLEAINFENQQFILTLREGIIFAYLVEKSTMSNNLKRYIDLLAEEFFIQFHDCLHDFNGDLSPFIKFEEVVNKYLVI
jgi:hypothetical protein